MTSATGVAPHTTGRPNAHPSASASPSSRSRSRPSPNPAPWSGRLAALGELSRVDDWWPWLAGLALGLVVLGPGLAPGSLLNLDLVLTPHIDTPAGLWGLGPELPRRAPFFVVLSWLSAWGGGAGAWKILAVVTLAVAFAGATRLVRTEPVVTRAGAGLLYAASPWALTRLGVGHLGLVLAAALLPWALDTLLRPTDAIWRTFLWAFGFALTGIFGALLAGPLLVAGLVGAPVARMLRAAGAFVAAQLIWLLPGIVVFTQGVRPASGASFQPVGEHLPDAVRLLAGHGFWQPVFQVGWRQGALAALVGVALFGLACFGHRCVGIDRRDRLAVVAAVGLLVPLAARLPLLRDVFGDVTRSPLALPLREPQRLLVLYLLWMAPAAAMGAARLSRSARAIPITARVLVVVVPALAGLVLAAPGLWGVQGSFDPVEYPPGWARVRSEIAGASGPVLALPWYRYFDLDVAGRRRVLNPLPYYLGGDVLSSSDPELPGGGRETADPRHDELEAVVAAMRGGDTTASKRLAELGIRWVVLLRDVDWRAYSLDADTGLRWVEGDETIALYEVTGWRGPLRTPAGVARPVSCPLPVLCRLDGAADGGVLARPYAWGWIRGGSGASSARGGLLGVPPSGAGWFAYLPGATILIVDAIVVGAATRCAVGSIHRRAERKRSGARA